MGPAVNGGGATVANAQSSARNSPAIGTAPVSSKPKSKLNSNGYHPVNAQNSLSSMTSAGLDLTSVERRGQPTAVREPVKKKSRPHGIQDAPTYCPTEEEWRDPLEYIKKISPDAAQYGICKIIPPDSWNPDFAIDTERFHFRTRKQELNSVEGSTRANLTYLDGLAKFHKQQGNNLHRLPYVDKKPLDLYRLKKAVESRGGFDKVCKLKKWAEIGRDLGYSGKIMSSLSTSLKNSYQRWLCPYEDYLRIAKPGVHQQLEFEYGGPLTPSPAPTPAKRSTVNTPASNGPGSPVKSATDALQSSFASMRTEGDRDTPLSDQPIPPAKPMSGFTAINSGGFTAINNNRSATSETRTFTPDVKRFDSPLPSSRNTPETRPASLAAAATLKRQVSREGSSEVPKLEGDGGNDEAADGSNRRSKRLKKDAVPTVAGSHMTVFRPSVPRISRDESATAPGVEKCETCGRGDDAGDLLTCDSCDHSYHGPCLDPPLKRAPEAEWNCPRCLVGDGQFGFEEGGLYSLRQFQQKANDFKQGYFERRMPFDKTLKCHRPVTEEDVETEFWRLVADLEETVEVEYGADIHCTTHGSGFPTVERHPNNPYSTDPCNLNVLPFHSDSLFRHIKSDISGMTVPWVYVGMIFSTFCWHNEDHYAYSANYQHFGATKTWYGIPGEDAEKFETAMRDAVPELFETQPDLLFQLVTLLTPEQLTKAGVRVYAIDQRAGQLVITYPQAYHAGFNHGFNFNEAVNFAPPDWEHYGLAGVERLQAFRRQPCFSHDELLWTAAEGNATGSLSIQTAKWLAPALDRVHKRELRQREDFMSKHAEATPHACQHNDASEQPCPLVLIIDDSDVRDDEECCSYCKAFSYLSRLKCLRSGKVLCIVHAGYHACCDLPDLERFAGTEHVLIYRKTADDMIGAHEKVLEKAHIPDTWETRYESALDDEITPSLKFLRNLLHEGERIPYELPSLPVLREFVERCNDWVEEATTYIVRKQQNRRKNEKSWQSSSRKSISGSQPEPKEKENRDVSNIDRLLQEANHIGFESPEITLLRERADAIKTFRASASAALESSPSLVAQQIEELLEEGRSFNVDIPEVERLSKVLAQTQWNERARASRRLILTVTEARELFEDAQALDIPNWNDHYTWYRDQVSYGHQWEKKAHELTTQDPVPYHQLEELSLQVYKLGFPVSQDIYDKVEQILVKHRETARQVTEMYERSCDPDFRQRPKYAEVVELIRSTEDSMAKPSDLIDLDNEKKNHEDWMRKGKKLFGKSNAPLHILKSHLDYVLERNVNCFDVEFDTPRLPCEPVSREASPEGGEERITEPRKRQVFCICRKMEAGMMIECELCREWYHSKCLKIARGKLKDEDLYTCPICDWRMRIPRDAARPKLEELMALADEMQYLPFQPDEEEVLNNIIDNAQAFRDRIAPFCSPLISTSAEVETQRFWLRKLEGAEVLLSFETNFFRQELHKWCPVAPEPPPILDVSLSTRKPRPTKLQKMLVEYGVDNPDDLPEHVKGKANSLRRKAEHAAANAAAAATTTTTAKSSAGTATTAPGSAALNHQQTLSASHSVSSHGGPAPHGNAEMRPASSSDGSELRPEPMDIDGMGLHRNTSRGGPQLHMAAAPSMSLEERLLQGFDDDIDLHTEAGKSKALEILSRTESGRKQAEKLWGGDVWGLQQGTLGDPGRSLTPGHVDDLMKGDEGSVDQMFKEMTNQDDEDEQKRKDGDAEHTITTESFENERNGLDAMIDGD